MKKIILLLTAVVFAGSLSAQKYQRGVILNPELMKNVPVKACMTRSVYQNLPAAASLQKWTPVPGNQGQTGTCVGWSSTYCIATMIWAMKNGVTNRGTITQNAMLPGYTYYYGKDNGDNTCQDGMATETAVEFLKNTGAIHGSNSKEQSCLGQLGSNWESLAAQNKISGYAMLFYEYDGYSNNVSDANKILLVKKALSEGKPLLVAFNCPDSMGEINSTGLWSPTENSNSDYGGHALACVAYDDSKFGGAFLIQNSWGTDYACNGYFWCTYSTFTTWCCSAIEINSTISNASGNSIDFTCADLNFKTSSNPSDYGQNAVVDVDNNNDNNNVIVDNNIYNNLVNDDTDNVINNDDNINDNSIDIDNFNWDEFFANFDSDVLYSDNDDSDSWTGYDSEDYTKEDYDLVSRLEELLDDSDYQDEAYSDEDSYDYSDYYSDNDDNQADEDYSDYYGFDQTGIDSQDWSNLFRYESPYRKVVSTNGDTITANCFSGSLKLVLSDGSLMRGKFDKDVINMTKSYKSGTRFRIYIGNNQPAYVYVFGTDLTNKTYNIFPQSRLVSPYLNYKNSRIAFPDENHFIETDNTDGTDYLYILYSLVPINSLELQKKLEQVPGCYESKLFNIMGEKTFSLKDCKLSGSDFFRFNALSAKKETLGIVVKINHTK